MTETSLPRPVAIALTPEQLQKIEAFKLGLCRQTVQTMAANNQPALQELLYRLGNSFKNRVIDPKSPNADATPEQMAMGLFVAVLMAGLGDIGVGPAPEPNRAARRAGRKLDG